VPGTCNPTGAGVHRLLLTGALHHLLASASRREGLPTGARHQQQAVASGTIMCTLHTHCMAHASLPHEHTCSTGACVPSGSSMLPARWSARMLLLWSCSSALSMRQPVSPMALLRRSSSCKLLLVASASARACKGHSSTSSSSSGSSSSSALQTCTWCEES
jgi:hypothetical protein